MPLAREQRKLAAIVAADVVGYSRLMGRDESGTLALMVATRGKPPAPAMGTQFGSVIDAPVGRHSEKPEVFYRLSRPTTRRCRRSN